MTLQAVHWAWLGALLLGLLLLAGIVIAFRRRDRLEGTLRRISWARLEDVLVPDEVDGEIHLDLALLTPQGILLLEVRRGAGTLFWGDQLDYWTLLDGRRRSQIRNPLASMRAKRHAVHALAPRVPVTGRILLLGPVSFSGEAPPGVLNLEGLAAEFPARGRDPAPAELREAWDAFAAQARRV